MSQLNIIKNNSNPDRIYYDIQVTNIESSQTEPPILSFNESRSVPFILVPEDYYFSIIRFTLETSTLPIFIPTMQYNDLQNQTIYSFQFSYDGFNSDEIFIVWSPQNIFLQKPAFISSAGITIQDNASGYYDCYNFEYFINLINEQLTTAFTTFQNNAFIAGIPLPASAVAPILAWDSSQNVARLIMEESFLTSNTTPIFLFFNSPLYNLFGSFNVLRNGYTLTNGKNFQILVIDFGGFNSYQLTNLNGDVYNVVEVIQEYSTISAWSPISSLVFTSNMMPIVSNQISKPNLFFEANSLSSYGNNSNFQQVITDFVSNNDFYKSSITYEPTAQYRQISLNGNTPISDIDINVFYKLRTGQLIPFKLGSGNTCTIKILFTKKGT